mmetsp:Transcript_30966/g.68574  ORF Transcript_30966/g.68574 Transcript_30966/m.68574 type:complete len:780 (+) Transcript_30966:793-3132(+)
MSEEQHRRDHRPRDYQYLHEASPPTGTHELPPQDFSGNEGDDFDCEPIDFRLPVSCPPPDSSHHVGKAQLSVPMEQYFPSPTDGGYDAASEGQRDYGNMIPTPHSYHDYSFDVHHDPTTGLEYRNEHYQQNHPGYVHQPYERTPSLPSPPKLPRRRSKDDKANDSSQHRTQEEQGRDNDRIVHPPYRRRGHSDILYSHPTPTTSEAQQTVGNDRTPPSTSTTSSSLLARGRTQAVYDMHPPMPVMLSSSSPKVQNAQSKAHTYGYQQDHRRSEAPSLESHPSEHQKYPPYHLTGSNTPSLPHRSSSYPRPQPPFVRSSDDSPPSGHSHTVPPVIVASSSYPQQHALPGYLPPSGMLHPPEYAGSGPHSYPPHVLYPYPPHLPPYYYHGSPSSLSMPLSLSYVEEVNNNDVLCGRGGATNSHVGNRNFRSLVKAHQERYLLAKKREKPGVAEYIVTLVRSLSPPGHFLKKDRASGKWFDIGDEKAKEKTAQALREGAPALRRQRERGENNNGDSSDGGSPGSTGGGVAPSDHSSNGSPSNAASPGGIQGAASSNQGDKSNPKSAAGESDCTKKRKKPVVEIEDAIVPADEGDFLGVEREVAPPSYRGFLPGRSFPESHVANERDDAAKALREDVYQFKGVRNTYPLPSIISVSNAIHEERDDVSSSAEENYETIETRDGVPQRKDKLAAPLSASAAFPEGAGLTSYGTKRSKRTKRPAMIRPTMDLTKRNMPPINIEDLSAKDQVSYMTDFLPPRANLQRGPRDGKRRTVNVTPRDSSPC